MRFVFDHLIVKQTHFSFLKIHLVPIFRFHLLVLSALVAVGLANEDVFLKWAKEQGKQYKTKAELTMRQAIFMKNYNRMVEHNKDFDAGKVTWARGVNQWYDLTMEEWRAEMGIGKTEPCNLSHTYLHALLKLTSSSVSQECPETWRSRTQPARPPIPNPLEQHLALGIGGAMASFPLSRLSFAIFSILYMDGGKNL